MKGEQWRERLRAAWKADGRKMRRISIEAGLRPNALWEALNRDATPEFDKLAALSREMNASVSYILEGIELAPENERLLRIWSHLTKAEQEAWLVLLEAAARQR